VIKKMKSLSSGQHWLLGKSNIPLFGNNYLAGQTTELYFIYQLKYNNSIHVSNYLGKTYYGCLGIIIISLIV